MLIQGYHSALPSTITDIVETGVTPVAEEKTTATLVQVVSGSANDTAAGTGVRTVTIMGLDGNYAPISETLTMNGTGAVASTKTFLKVTHFFAASVGSGGVAAGAITCKDSPGASSIYATIAAGQNVSRSAKFTAPAYAGAQVNGLLLAGTGSNIVTFHVLGNYNDVDYTVAEGVYRSLFTGQFAPSVITSGPYAVPLPRPLIIPAKGTVKIAALVPSATIAFTASMDITCKGYPNPALAY